MSDIDIASLDPAALEQLLQAALKPDVPVEIFYAALDHLVASPAWQDPNAATTRTGAHAAAWQPPMLLDGPMDGQANAVLRGGPFDGNVIHTDRLTEVTRIIDNTVHVYRPTVEIDDQYPTLRVFVHDRTEPVPADPA
jgi:hypothetical protein